MKFKVVNFRPERISGWVYNDESPKETVKLELFIDDRKAAEPLCDKFRNELDGRDFANRRIGFVERVPVQFWDGETHEVTLKIRGSDVVLRQEKMTLPNVRLAADSDLSAEVLSTENGQVTGWAA